MGILEERKAFEEGFERLQRIYKEWNRNPSALVRDSLKKYLIDCYDHLLKLDRIDIDAGKFEDSIISGANEIVEDPQIERVEHAFETPVQEESEGINIVLDEQEEIVEEVAEIEAPEIEMTETVEEKKAEEEVIAEEEEEQIEEVEMETEIATLETEVETDIDAKQEAELDPSEVYLSGSEEREIEEYFKNNFPQSEIDEIAVQKEEAEIVVNEVEEEEIVAETPALDEEAKIETEIVEEEIIEAVEEEVIAEIEEEQITPVISEIEEEEEEPEEEPKSRWSSFFSKDEPKPFEESTGGEQTQLTLADKLAVTKEEVGVHYEMKEQAITDLNAAIPIAKKFEFIRELFADDSTNYKTAVSSINEAGELQKALDISENLGETYNWSNKEKLAEEFNTFVKRRFS